MKVYLCNTCGEANSEKFDKNRKSTCKKCRNNYFKEHYLENKEHIKEVKKVYVENNKDSIRIRKRSYIRNKRNTDPGYRMLHNLRRKQNHVMKGRYSTTKGLGCDTNFLRSYMESLWEPWMNWGNYGNKKGQWSIDHITPISSFEKDEEDNWDSNSEYNKKLVHYTNLQPLLHKENIEKSNKIIVL